jgi:hypothetical protein
MASGRNLHNQSRALIFKTKYLSPFDFHILSCRVAIDKSVHCVMVLERQVCASVQVCKCALHPTASLHCGTSMVKKHRKSGETCPRRAWFRTVQGIIQFLSNPSIDSVLSNICLSKWNANQKVVECLLSPSVAYRMDTFLAWPSPPQNHTRHSHCHARAVECNSFLRLVVHEVPAFGKHISIQNWNTEWNFSRVTEGFDGGSRRVNQRRLKECRESSSIVAEASTYVVHLYQTYSFWVGTVA